MWKARSSNPNRSKVEVIMFSVYIWIDGEKFEADNFQQNLSVGLTGSVKTRKRMKDGVVEQAGKYWTSEVIEPISDDPETELFKLLMRYKNEILRAKTSC